MTPTGGVRPWAGRWIAAADRAIDDGAFHRVGFRKELDLDIAPDAATLRLSADSRYVLWVNGHRIGRGPARAQPHRWSFDEYDVAPFLRSGRNAIAVLVTYYGEDNAIWQRARVTRGLGATASLIVDSADVSDACTDESWTARTMDAWSPVITSNQLSALPIEVIDHRRYDESWLQSDGTAGRPWTPAAAARAEHPGGAGRSRPPVFPFGALRPREIGTLGGIVQAARAVSVSEPSLAVERGPVRTVHAALAEDAPLAHTNSAARRLEPDSAVLWVFDFGRVVAGYIEMDVDAARDTVIDLAYLERPFDPTDPYLPQAGARIITAGGRATFRALETNGMRYVAVLIRSTTDQDVSIDSIRLQEHLYPLSGSASFASSDQALTDLWAAGVRTMQLNSSDAFTDCPTREQRAWTGDGVVHLSVQLVANEDWRLARRYLELADSPRPDGLLPMAVAGDFEAAGRYTIPDWSLHWLHALAVYSSASQDTDFAAVRLPTAQRILRWFEQFLHEGVLTDVPEWPLGDWSSVFTNGASALLTALWARGLREFADLSEWVGNSADARRASCLYARTKDAFEVFWDAPRGVYVDHLLAGRRRPAVSQATNAAALVAGLVPDDRQGLLIERIVDEKLLVDRGWNAASPTVTLEQKQDDRKTGIRRVDWDAENQIVRAEPFFSSVVHDAVAVAGRADLVPRLLRRWQRFLDAGYDTFGECWSWGSPAHGWSSTPTRDLITHVLGVSPAALGSDAYRVAPARTGIGWMEASVPTRRGLLRVSVADGDLALDSPVPVVVTAWNGTILELPAGRCRVDLTAGTVLVARDSVAVAL